MRVSGAQLLVLYAESGAECFLPRQAMSAYVPSVSLLWQSVEEVCEIVRAETGGEVIEAYPYLQVVIPALGPPDVDQSAVAASWSAR